MRAAIAAGEFENFRKEFRAKWDAGTGQGA